MALFQPEIIETKRLILRPVTLSDTQDFFELDSNPKVHLYLGNNPVKHINESVLMVRNILDQYKSNGIGRLAIIKKDTDEFIGWSGLKYEQQLREDFSYYDLGYRLKEQFWGNGYASEAALASLEYGFKKLKLKEICAAALVENLASNFILNKIGMTPSGQFTYKDSLCNWYVIKKDDFDQ
ncbi:MAG: GNAT family N-acetyltransferase [Flavobacteriaceae bacterium]|uniref:GNAT family N-acetyltransferase n=1 Tax=Winogradskyella sp. SYSU M77433 TaxID=3042722 RepID=UPI000C42EC8E|nr:GNAT family N-acetyltransferase [Winogradskyella sp. SYSU M77433]MAX70003.1 GNAT family N-acetyltransferase [Flavobacteriaceae bacterium]MDH7914089.1 GNAT family N-acetyltransferase [Winogradskyella sp. SYSU M77433]|tara:strand:+ start:1302 stop:1844 length:543 start_codon:yes stop_codon:yes gene_type:complete